jgi:glycosyltransferase involved in cell wall biosynthesis
LIGPNHLKASAHARLKALENIYIPGQAPYAHLPKLMRGFDVCITPHLVTPFTESLNPLKLWEYLAAGKPIVSTDVAGFRDYPRHVRIAQDAESFLCAVRAGLREPPAAAQSRRVEAERHSWEVRLDAIEEVMRACLPRGAGSTSDAR